MKITKGIILKIVMLFLFTSGCSQVIVKPDMGKVIVPPKVLLYGDILYDKPNKAYLPKLIKRKANTDTVLKYSYSINYHNGDVKFDGLNLFNPLLCFGFPLSKSDLLVSGKLEVLKNENIIATFDSHCIAQKTRNLFNASGSSEGRKQCLNKIRDNIDSQIFIQYGGKL